MIGEIRQNFTEANASVGLILATALIGAYLAWSVSSFLFSLSLLVNDWSRRLAKVTFLTS